MAAMSPQGLLEALSAVADPRRRRGVRHRFISILALCACAVLAGARSFVAIAEWAMDLTPLLRAKLGIGRVPPCESTIRRVLQRVDPDVLDEAVSAWLAACSPAQTGRSVFALDGKTGLVQSWVRASCSAQGLPVKVVDVAVIRRVRVLLGGGGGHAGSGARGATSAASAPRPALA